MKAGTSSKDSISEGPAALHCPSSSDPLPSIPFETTPLSASRQPFILRRLPGHSHQGSPCAPSCAGVQHYTGDHGSVPAVAGRHASVFGVRRMSGAFTTVLLHSSPSSFLPYLKEGMGLSLCRDSRRPLGLRVDMLRQWGIRDKNPVRSPGGHPGVAAESGHPFVPSPQMCCCLRQGYAECSCEIPLNRARRGGDKSSPCGPRFHVDYPSAIGHGKATELECYIDGTVFLNTKLTESGR